MTTDQRLERRRWHSATLTVGRIGRWGKVRFCVTKGGYLYLAEARPFGRTDSFMVERERHHDDGRVVLIRRRNHIYDREPITYTLTDVVPDRGGRHHHRRHGRR